MNSELPQIPEIIDQSSVFIAQPAETIDQSSEFIPQPGETLDQSSILNFEAIPTTCSKEIYFNDISIREIPLLINPPQITDELADLVPEIYDIELLNVEKFDQAVIKSETYDFNNFVKPTVAKIDIPGIEDILNSITTSQYVPFEEIPQAEVKFYSPSFEIAKSNI